MKRLLLGLSGRILTAALTTACSSTSSGSPPPAPPPGGTAASPTPATAPGTTGRASVSVGATADGSALVNTLGFTLYEFKADTPTSSACIGLCVTSWPPAIANGTPSVGAGLKASLLTTLTRGDGAKQPVYNGHPLYTYRGDTAPGQARGEGNLSFGAGWFVLDAAGNQK